MATADILVFGYGTMSGAMVEGWLASGVPASAITAYNPRPKETPQGVAMVTEKPGRAFDVVVLGFKPDKLNQIAPEMAAVIGPSTIVLSILGGVTFAMLEKAFPQTGGLVRFMPNLAVAIGRSPNLLFAPSLSAEQRDRVDDLATRLGSAEWLEDEADYDLATVLAGSGPAFVYRFIDALAGGAANLGLPEDQARRLAVQMVEGAAALAAGSPYPPGELACRVASPGGMTQAGLDTLDAEQALAVLAENCLRATRDRGAELADNARSER